MSGTNYLESIYKDKRVFVTGHTGFKGSWILTWLHQLGATVKGYALAPETSEDLYVKINGDTLCESVIADIRDAQRLQEAVLSFQPDFIFHMAAQPLVRVSYQQPLYTFDVNVMGTANLMEAVRQLSKPCAVVVITTDKVYENNETGQAFREADKLGGYDPYSASKAAAEIVVNSYRSSFFNPAKYAEHKKAVASVRAGNVIGGGDRSKDRIIPDLVRAVESGTPLSIRNPSSVRPWQHVLEPVYAYLLLGACMTDEQHAATLSEAWNIGPDADDVLTVKEVAEQAFAVWGKGTYVTPGGENPHEAVLLILDNTKIKNELGWKPAMKSGDAIRTTIEWYKQSQNGDAYQITTAQISQFAQQL
ncbi:MAG: CDP-glucose 4,6-dehydratase [Bacteroidetes bacterium]|nr:CDP-glucose 4,6-dehydratase [Bacteroidota bacterium]